MPPRASRRAPASCSRSAGCATFRSSPSSTRWTSRAATRSISSTRSRRRWRSMPRRSIGRWAAGATGKLREMTIAEMAVLNPKLDAAAAQAEFDLVRGAVHRFELQSFREGHMTPVFFGSAIKNFGVKDLLDALATMAPPPRAQKADSRVVEADEPAMSAFVFKVQANMDPNHRDRIAFVRLCSGKLTRGMKVKQVRTGRSMSLRTPQFFFAQDRALAEEAHAGDVVGIPNHGILRIGDTLTEGEDINFVGVPSFAPEILRRVRLPDAMKAKKLKQALQELAEEGVAQVFRPTDGSPALVGVVGPLQLEGLKAPPPAENETRT